MRRKSKKGFTLVELMVGVFISVLTGYLLYNLFKYFSDSSGDQTVRMQINMTVRNILEHGSCCITIKKYFDAQALTVPAPPLSSANFTYNGGVLTIYDKNEQSMTDIVPNWQNRAVVNPGDGEMTVHFINTNPSKKYLNRDISTWQGRDAFTSEGSFLICPLAVKDYRPDYNDCNCHNEPRLCFNAGQNCNCYNDGTCRCEAPNVLQCNSVCTVGQICDGRSGAFSCGPSF
jgi:prepilin-type N-terminal cleavage/methylation domain-containing protein